MSSYSTGGLASWESKATGWSEWLPWKDDMEYRARMTAEGEWEYDTREADPLAKSTAIPRSMPPSTTLHKPGHYPTPLDGSHQHEPVYTGSGPSVIETVAQRISAVSLGSESEKGESRIEISGRDESLSRRISSLHASSHSKHFDSNYKVHRPKDFAFGKVVQVLWSEDKTELPGNRAPIRRFVVVRVSDKHCNALPINSKVPHSHDMDYAIIYTSNTIPAPMAYEDNLLTPIHMVPSDNRHLLKPEHRIYYSKVYTIEYNVKAWFIGSIHRDSKQQLVEDYNRVHPPLGIYDNTSSIIPGATATPVHINEEYSNVASAQEGRPHGHSALYTSSQGLEPNYSQSYATPQSSTVPQSHYSTTIYPHSASPFAQNTSGTTSHVYNTMAGPHYIQSDKGPYGQTSHFIQTTGPISPSTTNQQDDNGEGEEDIYLEPVKVPRRPKTDQSTKGKKDRHSGGSHHKRRH